MPTDASAPIIPWEPFNIPDSITAELERRRVNRGFNYVKAEQGEWGGTTGQWTKYRGPMVPWIRLCSNGQGSTSGPAFAYKPGFVMFSGQNFYSGYGFNKSSAGGGNQIIGYLPDGKTQHTIPNDPKTSNYPIHVPPPQIDKVTVTVQQQLYRQAVIEWTCFSKKQLEYMTPYFLVPGISCVLEWGWNHFNPSVLLNLDDVNSLKQFFKNPYPLYTDHILQSNGNYDILLGKITNFEWSADGNKLKCKTEITSWDRLYAGLITDANVIDKSQGKINEKPLDNLPEFIEQVVTQMKQVATTSPGAILLNQNLVTYLQKHHKNDTWKDYAYAVFWGRDTEINTPMSDVDNKKVDFDRVAPYENMWISLGLVMEIINYHVSDLQSHNGGEAFRVDIDDVVVTGNPNLISTDGSVLLIPNKFAPHYFSGQYGSEGVPTSEYAPMEASDIAGGSAPADLQLMAVTQDGIPKRDDHDRIINWIRKQNGVKDTEFPFATNHIGPGKNSKPYPEKFSGYLKNLFLNVNHLKLLTSRNSGIKTYAKLVEKILEDINKSAGNFWDFRLVSATGKQNESPDQATMKIMDYRFMMTANSGTKVYTFDYMDADALLQSLAFKPQLSTGTGNTNNIFADQ